jgi:RNA polymerase sigma-70 factor (ECF subfamily)
LRAIDWHIIIKKHGPVVWQTAYRLLGEHNETADCFQETFLSALELTQHQHVRNFRALLIRLATARAIDRLRQKFHKSLQLIAPVDLASLASVDPGPSQQLQMKELTMQLRKAISMLPPQEAKAFCLRYLNDMSYRQIAYELNIKRNAAGVLLHRAKTKLQQIFEPTFSNENEVKL